MFTNAGSASSLLASDQFYTLTVILISIGFLLLPRRMALFSTGLRLFIVSGILGYAFGSTYYAGFQAAVEPAQVLSGIVKYPSNSSFYLYQVNNWTLIHHIGALGFRLGLNEDQISRVLSGLQLASAYQALTLLGFALSKSAVFSLLLIPFMEAIHIRGYSEGFNYPLNMVSGHTYGVFSIMFPMTAVALVGAGMERLGGLWLGIATAVHPATGAWTLATTLLAFSLRFKFNLKLLMNERRRFIIFLALGLSLSIASFIFHRILFYVPPVETLSPEQVLKAQTFFLLNWDFHRFFYLSGFKKLLSDFPSFWNWALSIGLTPIFLAGFFTASLLASRTKTGLTPPQLDLLTVILVMFLGGWTLVTIHQQLMHEPAFLEKYPVFLWILKSMPNRLLNLVSFAMFPLVIGILFARRGQLVPALLLIGILACPIFLKDVHSRWDLRKVSYILCVIAVPAVCLTHMKIRPIYCTLLLCLISIVLTNRTMISPFSFLRQHHRHEYQLYPDLASIPSSGKFMITGPGLSWAQYFTRRPQLVSPGQLDYLSYAQGGWTEVIDVLKDIYGVDYYAHVAHHGSIVQYPPNQIAFENKTREDWYRLGEKYNADLLTVEYRYKIDLPPLYIKPNYFIVYSLVRPVSDQFKL